MSCLQSASVEVFLPTQQFDYLGSFHNGKDYDRAQPADIFLASPRWRCDQELSGVVLHHVERLGAPLVTIIAVTP